MKVTEIADFQSYWSDARYLVKRPFRNGSLVMMVGDNIYHRDEDSGDWIQEDSHHSSPDGSPNLENLETDTSADRVLISSHFYYFGCVAPKVDLDSIGFNNVRNYRRMLLNEPAIGNFLFDFEDTYLHSLNAVIADPFDFQYAFKRVDQSSGRIVSSLSE
jgi:hypothetical protein